MEQSWEEAQAVQGRIGILFIGVREGRIDFKAGMLEGHQGSLHMAEGGDQQDALHLERIGYFFDLDRLFMGVSRRLLQQDTLRRNPQPSGFLGHDRSLGNRGLTHDPPGEEDLFRLAVEIELDPPHQAMGRD